MESNYKKDQKLKQMFDKFMDDNLYYKLNLRSSGKCTFTRKSDKDSRISGVNVIMSYNGNKFNISEKSALHYVNKRLSTFSFEIGYISEKTNRWLDGWYVDNNLKTDYYMLSWPQANVSDWKELDNSDQFTKVEAMFIKKDKLKKEIAQCKYKGNSLDDNLLKQLAIDLRQDINGNETLSIGSGLTLITSAGKYAEAPINLLIDKEILRKCADASFSITKDGIYTSI